MGPEPTMGTSERKPLLDRAFALVAGPLLLGRHAVEAVAQAATTEGPPKSPEAPPRMKLTPPDHSVMRRG